VSDRATAAAPRPPNRRQDRIPRRELGEGRPRFAARCEGEGCSRSRSHRADGAQRPREARAVRRGNPAEHRRSHRARRSRPCRRNPREDPEEEAKKRDPAAAGERIAGRRRQPRSRLVVVQPKTAGRRWASTVTRRDHAEPPSHAGTAVRKPGLAQPPRPQPRRTTPR